MGTDRAVAAWSQKLRFSDTTAHRPDEANGVAITFTAYRVVFQVLGHFHRGGATLLDDRAGLKPALLRLWPTAGGTLAWPPPHVFGDESLDLLINSIRDGTNG
jgi:hypothetical protein